MRWSTSNSRRLNGSIRGWAGGGRDEGQVAVQTLVEPLDQPGAADYVRPKPREIQFRGENGRRHACLFSWPLRPAFFFRARTNRYKERCAAFKSTYVGGLHPCLQEAPECLLPCSSSTHLLIQHCLHLSNVGEGWGSPALFPKTNCLLRDS